MPQLEAIQPWSRRKGLSGLLPANEQGIRELALLFTNTGSPQKARFDRAALECGHKPTLGVKLTHRAGRDGNRNPGMKVVESDM